MPLDPDSYLPGFFTEEKLAHLRSLSERFPLRCGLWPPEEASLPEYWEWTADALLGRELPDGGIALWQDSPERSKLVAPTVAMWKDHGFVVVEVEPPTVPILAAINYAFHDWNGVRKDYHPSETLRSWANRLQQIILRTTPRNIAFLFEDGVEPELAGDLLLHLREAAIREPRGRKGGRAEMLKALDDVWRKVGEAVGILPQRQSGGLPETLLTDAFLHRLLDELRRNDGLIYNVIRFHPSQDDLQVAAGLGVQEEQRDLWCRHLLFPVLHADEVQRIMSYTGGYVSTKIDTLSLDLLAARLPISRGRLKNRLSG